jgi:hypothetical protein
LRREAALEEAAVAVEVLEAAAEEVIEADVAVALAVEVIEEEEEVVVEAAEVASP